MKPKVEAKRLVDKFNSKELALLCVDEIVSAMNNSGHGGAAWSLEIIIKKEDFWYKVKEHIVKL